MAKENKIVVMESSKTLDIEQPSSVVTLSPVTAPIPVPEKKFNFRLVIVHPFDKYQKGQKITNDVEIEAILASGKDRHCSKTSY